MDTTNFASSQAAARARIAEIDDAVASIRAQLASADMQRQRTKQPIDPRWFHGAKTALRHLQRERADLTAATGACSPRRDRVKDCIIAVLRERHDEQAWAAVLDEANRRVAGASA